jgi:hypothetical protein
MTCTSLTSRCRGLLVALAAVGVALTSCTAPPATSTARTPGPVELRWYCWNGIFAPAGEAGDRWWAGGFPAPTGPLETDPVPGDGNHVHVATGVIAVEGPTTATFTADAGGELPLRLVGADTVFPAFCQMAPT